MKKILYVTTVSSTINAFLVPHIKRLIELGYRVDCASSKNRELDNTLAEIGVNFFELTFTRNPLDLSNIKAFNELIRIQKKNKYDVVHVHTPIASLYGRLLKLIFPDLKTIYTAHGFHFYKGAPKKNWIIYYSIEKVMAKFTDIIITMNEEDYKRALTFNIRNTYKSNGVGLDLSKYNSSLFDKNKIREEFGLKASDFVMVMIAEVNKNKNHIQMIKSIEILKKKGIEIKVLCAGKGPLKEIIEDEIKLRNLESNIYMLGFRNDIPKIISACDVGILLSYREGLPRNIMEIMAYGKPMIGTNIRGIRDIIKDGFNGFLVGIDNPEETSDKILQLINDRDLTKQMNKNSYYTARSYSQDKVVNQLVDILDKLNRQ